MDLLSPILTGLGAAADALSLAPLLSSPLKKAVEVANRRHRTDSSMREAIEAALKSGELDYYAEAIIRGLPYDVEGLTRVLVAHRGQRSVQALADATAAAERLLADIESALLEDDAIRVVVSIIHRNEAQRQTDQQRLESMMGQMLQGMEALKEATEQQGADRQRIEEAEGKLRGRLENVVKALNEDRVEDALQEVDRSIEDLDLLHAFLPDDRFFRQSASILKAQVYTLRGQWADRDDVIQGLRQGPPLIDELVLQAAELAAVAEDEEWLEELVPRLVEKEEERSYASAALHWIRRDVEGTLRSIPDDTENPDLLFIKAQALTYRLEDDDPAAVAALLEQLDGAEGLPFARVMAGRLGTHLLQRVINEHAAAPGLERDQLVKRTRERFDRAIEAYEPVADQHPIGYLQALSGKMEFLSFLHETKEAIRLSEQVHQLQPDDLPFVTIEMAKLVEDDELIERLAEETNESPSRIATARGARAAHLGDTEGSVGYLLVALREAETRADYTLALEVLAHLYFREDHDAAADLLAQEHALVSADDLAYLEVQFAFAKDGHDAAIQSVDEQLETLPKSLPLLRLKYELLEYRVAELIERRKQGEWLGDKRILTYEAMEDAARKARSLLPCPKHKAQLAAPIYNLGRRDEAMRLVDEAAREGITEDELPKNLTSSDPL